MINTLIKTSFFMIIALIVITSSSAFAKKEQDKLRLDELTASHAELRANSTDYKVVIDSAKKIYRLTRKVYGKNSLKYAESTYQLANLYDIIGGYLGNSDERKTLNYYEDYFRLAEKINIPIDDEFVKRYVIFIKNNFSVRGKGTNPELVDQAIQFARSAQLPPSKIGEIEIDLATAGVFILSRQQREILLSAALGRYRDFYGDQHFKFAESLIILGKFKSANLTSEEALANFEQAVNILDEYDLDTIELKDRTHSLLVEYYETIEHSDLATYHSGKLATERDPNSKNLPKLLFGHYPNLNDDPNVKRGYNLVKLELTIDVEGKVSNVEVAESSNEDINQKVIDAIASWRFTPSLVNGELAEVKDVFFSYGYQWRN